MSSLKREEEVMEQLTAMAKLGDAVMTIGGFDEQVYGITSFRWCVGWCLWQVIW